VLNYYSLRLLLLEVIINDNYISYIYFLEKIVRIQNI